MIVTDPAALAMDPITSSRASYRELENNLIPLLLKGTSLGKLWGQWGSLTPFEEGGPNFTKRQLNNGLSPHREFK